jgi:hypothetical protein
MMKRRTETPISAQKLFDDVLYSSLHWPWKTVRLERNSLLDYRQRSTSASISIAELYHENTKLFPQILSELTVVRLQADEFRREFVRRRAAAARADGTAGLSLDPSCCSLLSAVAKATGMELFYAIELRIVTDGLLALHEPVLNTLQIAKQLSAGDRDVLRRALRLMATPAEPLHNEFLIFILGCFARNELLFGPRGYRRTLMEAGQMTQEILRHAGHLGLMARPLYEFIDRDVDAILETDGTEKGTLVALELGGVPDVR